MMRMATNSELPSTRTSALLLLRSPRKHQSRRVPGLRSLTGLGAVSVLRGLVGGLQVLGLRFRSSPSIQDFVGRMGGVPLSAPAALQDWPRAAPGEWVRNQVQRLFEQRRQQARNRRKFPSSDLAACCPQVASTRRDATSLAGVAVGARVRSHFYATWPRASLSRGQDSGKVVLSKSLL